MKATQFYISHLISNEKNTLLPEAISSAIEGRLGMFEDRISRLLFKQAVELAMMETILAEQLELDPGCLKELRGWCVDAVKHTNGKLSFAQLVEMSEGS